MPELPVIDVAPLVEGGPRRHAAARRIGDACERHGFFYAVNHGIDESLQRRLEEHSRAFFDLPPEIKLRIRMTEGGRAWRGYFPVGGELTDGRPDLKEGLYFGAELPPGDKPMHGPNLFPADPPGLRPAVLEYLDAMSGLGHALMGGVALALGHDERHFRDRYTKDPLILFRIFNYPPATGTHAWGVGEHTDYGLLTILKQDGSGGLQVRTPDGGRWVDADPVEGSFVCNLGDMLARLSGGRYRSTPHRVLPPEHGPRLSWPFFFDPNFDAPVGGGITYGAYLLAKVGRVFPDLGREVL